MEARLTVTGQPELYYQLCLELFQADYQGATGQTIPLSEIREGLSFVKRFGKKREQSVKVTLQQLVENQSYAVAIQSNRGVQFLTYQLRSLGQDEVEICYSEDYLPEGRFNQLNYKLLLPLMRRSLEKRMLLQIKKFAEFAIKKEVP
ncbi:DUF3284 domain-containing protein [Streptococcus sp. zg-86]|uniref:DUF3284 domain-containing protein n=1 Tax=Streptococcus zhangguiae TaxID=2664091 RepID=A0A6I4RBG6_9STRE|nr:MULTISPECIES: DUF3284 domain-containing protein [Streptococcus]MTB64842.1 DUF3284 domain-containing protein [Streptococcus sp. zg-86]MTB91088.1 DUF3284 domain-containing protein [Streptococcus sp. zg-36]MWV56829.1 DUF3284 domain-containing protein [Streptococcus sp. zg-70]QTH48365.1 DUF3284 domain-containing protein [Streptococcus sp. zg-86]